MEKYTMFMDQRNQYSENEYTTQSNLQIQCNPYQATNSILHRTRTNNFTICMEMQKYLLHNNSKSNKRLAGCFQTLSHLCLIKQFIMNYDFLYILQLRDIAQILQIQFQTRNYQATNSIFQRARTNNFTSCMEIQKNSNSQSNLEKEGWNWRNQPA